MNISNTNLSGRTKYAISALKRWNFACAFLFIQTMFYFFFTFYVYLSKVHGMSLVQKFLYVQAKSTFALWINKHKFWKIEKRLSVDISWIIRWQTIQRKIVFLLKFDFFNLCSFLLPSLLLSFDFLMASMCILNSPTFNSLHSIFTLMYKMFDCVIWSLTECEVYSLYLYSMYKKYDIKLCVIPCQRDLCRNHTPKVNVSKVVRRCGSNKKIFQATFFLYTIFVLLEKKNETKNRRAKKS